MDMGVNPSDELTEVLQGYFTKILYNIMVYFHSFFIYIKFSVADHKPNHEFEATVKTRQLLERDEETSGEINTHETEKPEPDLAATPHSVHGSLNSENVGENSKNPERHRHKTQDSNAKKENEEEENISEGYSKSGEEKGLEDLPVLEPEEPSDKVSENELAKGSHQKSNGETNLEENESGVEGEEESLGHIPNESKNKEESEVSSEDNGQEATNHKGQGTKKHKDIGEELIGHKKEPENVAKDHGEHHPISPTTTRPWKGALGPNIKHKVGAKGQGLLRPVQSTTKSSNESGPTAVPIEEECTVPGKIKTTFVFETK